MSEKKCPMVSVICPTYNHAPYLRKALDSILMQKVNFPFEVLVGEDCSTDDSRAILQEYEASYPGFFTILYREKNMGATNNGNDMRTRARGKYIASLETDDYWTDPHKLQKQVDFLELYPEYIGVAHNFKIANENGDTIEESGIRQDLLARAFTLDEFLKHGFVFQTATCIYRNFMTDGQDYSIIKEAHSIIGDFTIFSILISRGDLYILPDNMSVYRKIVKKHGSSFSSQSMDNHAQLLFDRMDMYDKLERYFQGRIRYDSFRVRDICSYLFNWFTGREGFKASQLYNMMKQANASVRRKVGTVVLKYPVRKIGALFGKKYE